MKSIFLFLFLSPLSIILLTSPVSSHAASDNSLIGNKPPAFSLPDVNGRHHNLSEWRNKFIILNFWATWCAPCKKEIPLFNEFQEAYSDEIQFIGIAIDNAKDVSKFTKIIPINYPNLIGGLESTGLVREYGNKAGTLPYTIFITKHGKIISIASGEITRRFLEKILEKHL